MKILAIDPGYERLGVAVLEKSGGKESALFSCCLTTNKNQAHSERLAFIGDEVEKIIKKLKPESLTIESLFLFSNQKTAMKVAEARGVILCEAARAGLPVFEYTPLQIKIAVTGYGKSDKRQVAEMARKLLSLPDKKRLDDEYDALAIGLTFFATEKSFPQKALARKN